MRRITANIIYPVTAQPLSNAYIELDDFNKIIRIKTYNRSAEEPSNLEYYSGVLVPGFINAHCHSELSHLKGKIDAKTGLKIFVNQVQLNRKASNEKIEQNIQQAIHYMYSRGINGIGDVVNSAFGLQTKKNSSIQFYNFVELFNENNKAVNEILEKGIDQLNKFENEGLLTAPTPHSMYGTNRELLQAINAINAPGYISSLHFLESHWEANIEAKKIYQYIKQLENSSNILMIHNLFLNQEILDVLSRDKHLFEKLYWVMCINSNLYIENSKPLIGDFIKWKLKLCIGTDSLASNHTLSILDEMKTMRDYFPEVSFQTMLEWATINGAKALNMHQNLGSFEPGKSPGIILIENFNFKEKHIKTNSEIKRIV